MRKSNGIAIGLVIGLTLTLSAGCAMMNGEPNPFTWSTISARPVPKPPAPRRTPAPDPRLPDLTRASCGPCGNGAVLSAQPGACQQGEQSGTTPDTAKGRPAGHRAKSSTLPRLLRWTGNLLVEPPSR